MDHLAAPKPAPTRRTTDAGAVSKPSAATALSAGSQSRPIRKRTKTGCLTCRKRRIKCTEEKPICSNCIKSKRECEGYAQPVIFKTPLAGWYGGVPSSLSHGLRTLEYHNAGLPLGTAIASGMGTLVTSEVLSRLAASGASDLVAGMDFGFQGGGTIYSQHTHSELYPPTTSPIHNPQFFRGQLFPSHPFQHGPQSLPRHQIPSFPHQAPPTSHPAVQYPDTVENTIVTTTTTTTTTTATKNIFHNTAPSVLGSSQPSPSLSSMPGAHSNIPSLLLQAVPQLPTSQRLDSTSTSVANYSDFRLPRVPLAALEPPNQTQPTLPPLEPDLKQDFGSDFQGNINLDNSSVHHYPDPHWSDRVDELPKAVYCGPAAATELQYTLETGAVEIVDDNYFDVNSDDEAELDASSSLGMIVDRVSPIDGYNLLGSRPGLISGPIDLYQPENVASPLRNPSTAAIFGYFINYTGPSLSLYERVSGYDPAINGPTDSLPYTKSRGVWNYSMPMLALGNQLLLHAMLAMASLQIAKRQDTSVTPSLKHYAFALKRLHQALGSDRKRHDVATLAAALLLGFYEVTTGDHLKWSSHLAGARLLVAEVDYVELTRAARRLRPRDKHYIDQEGLKVLSLLSGQDVNYDDGSPIRSDPQHGRQCHLDQLALSRFDLYQDMFWWYCHQDTFQSVVSGNKLLRDFSGWTSCPPRGRFGDVNNVLGTHDHMVILLGRVADFSARDRKRKIRMQKAGLSGPPPGMGPPHSAGARPPSGGGAANAIPTSSGCSGAVPVTPSGSSPSFCGGQPLQAPLTSRSGFVSNRPAERPGSPSPLSSTSPPFYGMAPVRQGKMPSYYDPKANTVPRPSPFSQPGLRIDPASSPPLSSDSEVSSADPSSTAKILGQATQQALQDWDSILKAVNAVPSNLPPEFHPVQDGWDPAVDPVSPFGPPLMFRNVFVALVWAHYHMCQILIHRAHPHMPPASLVAAGAAASRTGFYANEIGRIAAGIIDITIGLSRSAKTIPNASSRARSSIADDNTPIPDLNPTLIAALFEITIPLFCAGVQFCTDQQRRWLVDRLHLIHVQTGFESAPIIANGCQKAWRTAGEKGFGPKWRSLIWAGGKLVELEALSGIDTGVGRTMERPFPESVDDDPGGGGGRCAPTQNVSAGWSSSRPSGEGVSCSGLASGPTAGFQSGASANFFNSMSEPTPNFSFHSFPPGNPAFASGIDGSAHVNTGANANASTSTDSGHGGAAGVGHTPAEINAKRIHFAMGLLSLDPDEYANLDMSADSELWKRGAG